MADIDDELLALAGGGESSDEEEVMSEAESRAQSTSPPPKAAAKTPVAKKAKKRAGEDGSDEEGEAFSAPGSPNSIGSAAMDESDSEAEPHRAGHDDDEEDKYPVDGMFRSLAEKEQVMAMREVERESLLAERQAEIERHRQNRMLRQLVSKQENEEKKQKLKKRSADAADLEDASRKNSRPRTDGKTSAIDTLRRARAEKSDRARRREEDRQKGTRSPHDDYRDQDSDEGGDWEERDRRRHHKSRSPDDEIVARELPPPDIRDFERVRVGKSRFAEYCFNPGFETAMIGCYVRISIGPDPKTGQDEYRMARIQSITVGKPYAMTGPGGSFVTDQYVLAAHGKAERPFPFIFLSDRPFTEREYNRYEKVIQSEGLTLPKKQVLLSKIEDINALIAHHLTTTEIDERILRKNALRKKFDPKLRERLAQEIEVARLKGNTSKAEELQEQLDDLKTNVLAFKTSLIDSSSKPNTTSQQDRLANINRQRRLENAENVRRAQLKEKAEARKLEAALERGEDIKNDLSRRLRTKAKFIHDANDASKKSSGKDSNASTPANGTPKIGAQEKNMLPNLAKLQAANQEKKGIPTIHKPLMDDDIIGALDLDIDVEID
ncbi:RNA polymerase II transcription elongation factor [Colletotrichum tofieldiae]|uniref:RNA polymerase II transcription elongation factor n=2 Tax=Colletotrichum spaethianum species complex TaxID=2707349 RepID=A0A166XT06_9PEZI|nr:RNA polymerase II transcription elongation factor [Colletotrichum tofieldiae]GKT60534.1 RNA polymerase II transcription elongation factor [Colletotrichum tofieldiae]GKT68239.1 RNA polymerase II transcription elongation factor [Colletotrichum tofieldiae]